MLLFLGSLMLVMTIIRRREESSSSLSISKLNALQKGWVFLFLLAPGLSASILSQLTLEEKDRLLKAGETLKGSTGKVASAVLGSFFQGSQIPAPGKEVSEVCSWLRLKFEDEPKELANLFRTAFL